MNPFEFALNSNEKFQYVSIERVIQMVLKDYKFINQVKIADAIEWIGSIYGLINYPGLYRKKLTGTDSLTPNIAITNHRGELPVDFIKVMKGGVRDYDTKEVLGLATGTYAYFSPYLNDEIHKSYTKQYKISGGYIFTESDVETIEMAYDAFPIDERGYPLVPNDERLLQYAKDFIAERLSFNLLAEGKINQFIYLEIEKRALWGAGSSATALINPSVEVMDMWTRMRMKLVPRFNMHDTSYAYLTESEDLALGTNLE